MAGAAAYTATPYRRLRSMIASRSLLEKLEATTLVPIIRVTGDAAKMIGYPVGRVWRWRNRKRPEIHWR